MLIQKPKLINSNLSEIFFRKKIELPINQLHKPLQTFSDTY